jgi:hypothetical protein
VRTSSPSAAFDVPKRFIISCARLGCQVWLRYFRGDSLGGEVHAGGSVEIGAAVDAPQAEYHWIEINTLGDRALALELHFRMLGLAEPLVIGGGKLR